jgi:hypothetical protein
MVERPADRVRIILQPETTLLFSEGRLLRILLLLLLFAALQSGHKQPVAAQVGEDGPTYTAAGEPQTPGIAVIFLQPKST